MINVTGFDHEYKKLSKKEELQPQGISTLSRSTQVIPGKASVLEENINLSSLMGTNCVRIGGQQAILLAWKYCVYVRDVHFVNVMPKTLSSAEKDDLIRCLVHCLPLHGEPWH